MKKHSGASLILVLMLSSLALFIALNVFLIFEWSTGSTGAKNNLMKKRIILESLISESYHWLLNKLETGHAYNHVQIDENIKLDDLKIFSKNSEQAYVNIYNMSYDCTVLVKKADKFKWRSSDGSEKFFPSKNGAFLIRAVYDDDSSDTGIMFEAVITRDDKKLCSLEETWF